jgi:hypothetical protein
MFGYTFPFAMIIIRIAKASDTAMKHYKKNLNSWSLRSFTTFFVLSFYPNMIKPENTHRKVNKEFTDFSQLAF